MAGSLAKRLTPPFGSCGGKGRGGMLLEYGLPAWKFQRQVEDLAGRFMGRRGYEGVPEYIMLDETILNEKDRKALGVGPGSRFRARIPVKFLRGDMFALEWPDDPDAAGGFDPDRKTIFLNNYGGLTLNQPVITLRHELQHAIDHAVSSRLGMADRNGGHVDKRFASWYTTGAFSDGSPNIVSAIGNVKYFLWSPTERNAYSGLYDVPPYEFSGFTEIIENSLEYINKCINDKELLGDELRKYETDIFNLLDGELIETMPRYRDKHRTEKFEKDFVSRWEKEHGKSFYDEYPYKWACREYEKAFSDFCDTYFNFNDMTFIARLLRQFYAQSCHRFKKFKELGEKRKMQFGYFMKTRNDNK